MHQINHNLIIFFNNLGDIYSLGFLLSFSTLIVLSLFLYLRPKPYLENYLFWGFGIFLVAFSALRPIGIGRDDLAGYAGLTRGICSFLECLQPIQSSRDWAWYFSISILKSLFAGERAALVLSAIGTLIQIFIIYRLCRQKLLALALYIPLVYIYFNITLLRAGSALTLFFVGLYFLVHSRKILGSTILLGNYLFHSQGIFSIGIVPFSWIAKYKYASIAVIITTIACIYLRWTLPEKYLGILINSELQAYWFQYLNGIFSKEKIFPSTNLLIMGYLIFILLADEISPKTDLLQRYALASSLLAVFLMWSFAPIHAAQTRLFDFYIAPLVFIAGNLKLNRYAFFATLGLAILLYIRIELIHNWLMG